jgi:hypothetical protein
MAMQCPKCQSQDVSLCSVVHAQGTVKTTTHTQGMGSSTGHIANLGMTTMQTQSSQTQTSQSKTAFAERAAPPTPPILYPIGALALLLFLRVGLPLVSTIHPLGLGWLALVVVAAWLFMEFKKLPQRSLERREWEKSWICGRCGMKFIPKEESSAAAV